jgi:transposase
VRQKTGPEKEPATEVVKNIRRATRRHFSAEDKIRIVLEGLRGEDSIAELCRREGIVQNLYYRRSKEFLEAGKKRLAGDTARAATSDEVKELRREASALKEVVAELTLENRLLKKSVTADGEDGRPATGQHPVMAVRLPQELIERIDEWMKACDARSRLDGIRQLIELGLGTSVVKTRQPKKPRQQRSRTVRSPSPLLDITTTVTGLI